MVFENLWHQVMCVRAQRLQGSSERDHFVKLIKNETPMLQWGLKDIGYAWILWGQLRMTMYRIELAQENDSKARRWKWPKSSEAHDFIKSPGRWTHNCFVFHVGFLYWFDSVFPCCVSFFPIGDGNVYPMPLYAEVWNMFLGCIEAYCKRYISFKLDSPLKPLNNIGSVKDPSTITNFVLRLNAFLYEIAPSKWL